MTDNDKNPPVDGGAAAKAVPPAPVPATPAEAPVVAENKDKARKPRSRRKRNWAPFDGQSGAESPYLRKG